MLKLIIVFLCVIGSVFSGTPQYANYLMQEDYVPILGYHKIGDSITSTEITYDRFHEQVEYLTNTFGCNWLSMNDLAHHIQNGEKLPTNACIMNFDDGAASQLFSLCSLNKYQIPATFYIPEANLANSSEYIENEDWIVRNIELDGRDKHDYYMYPQELELIHSWGQDIQSHTLTHADLPTLDYDGQWEEIYQSIVNLEDKGYEITSFAYPYGNYDETTIQIMHELFDNGTLVLGRNTEKKNSWREQRSVVFNISDQYSYNYIKPETYTPEELAEKISYTYWYQIEENYVVYNDSVYEQGENIGEPKTSITTNAFYTPGTDTTFGVLATYSSDAIIETQFATKYKSGIVVDILSYHPVLYGKGDCGYYITIDNDDTIYYPERWESSDDNYIHIERVWNYGATTFHWYNFWVEFPDLDAGVHTLRIYKSSGQKLYIDKFRVFSEIDQTFSQSYGYNYKCTSGDHNCDCSYNEDTENSWGFHISITEMQMVIIICILVGVSSFCLCMNTGSNREFRKYGHIKNQRERFLASQNPMR